MRFFSTLLVGASAIASLASAQTQPFFTWQVPAAVKVGETYNVTYSAAGDSPVTIILRKGPSTDLATLSTLTSTSTGGSYLWTPAKDLADGADYALQIKQSGNPDNYSKQFAVSGGSAASSSASSSASTASATASTTSSASASASSNATTTLTTTHTGNSTISATGTPSASGHSSSATGTRATGSSTSSAAGGAPTTGAANNLKSPMALVFGAVAAMVYLH